MRILYISADYGIPILGNKGGSVHIREMTKVFRKLGHEVITVTPRTDGDCANRFGGNLVEVTIPDFQKEILQNVEQNDHDNRSNQALFKEIRSIITNRLIHDHIQSIHRERPIDLIYERFSLWNYAGAEAAEMFGVPHILEVNAPLSIEQERYRLLHCKSLALGIEDVLFEKTDVIIVVSEGLRKYIMRKGISSSKIHVIPNSVDPGLFNPGSKQTVLRLKKKLSLPSGVCIIGFLGSLKKWHGVEVMIDAVRKLFSHTTDVHLLIVGDGPLRAHIEEVTEEEQFRGRITLSGEIPYSEVPDYIRIMDIPIAPYLPIPEFYFSPLKLYEYMATGKPMVASRIGQIPEVVQEGKTGLLCIPGSPEDLTGKLWYLMEHPELRKAIGRAAREWIMANSDWKRNAREVLTIAEGLCRRNRALAARELLIS